MGCFIGDSIGCSDIKSNYGTGEFIEGILVGRYQKSSSFGWSVLVGIRVSWVSMVEVECCVMWNVVGA